MTAALLLREPVATPLRVVAPLTCVACLGTIDGPSDTGLYCAHCACHRCGEDATGAAAAHGYCDGCAADLAVEQPGFLG